MQCGETLTVVFSTVSPYTTLADWVNIHGNTGLRVKIPKPIYFNVNIEVKIR